MLFPRSTKICNARAQPLALCLAKPWERGFLPLWFARLTLYQHYSTSTKVNSRCKNLSSTMRANKCTKTYCKITNGMETLSKTRKRTDNRLTGRIACGFQGSDVIRDLSRSSCWSWSYKRCSSHFLLAFCSSFVAVSVSPLRYASND